MCVSGGALPEQDRFLRSESRLLSFQAGAVILRWLRGISVRDKRTTTGRILLVGFWLCIVGWLLGALLHDRGVLTEIHISLFFALASFVFGVMLFSRWAGRKLTEWTNDSATE